MLGRWQCGWASQSKMQHPTGKTGLAALNAFHQYWQKPLPGTLVPRGRHLCDFSPLPNILNKMQSTHSLACTSETAGAKDLSAFFPFYILIRNSVFFYIWPWHLKSGGKADSNKKAIESRLTTLGFKNKNTQKSVW